MIKNKICLLLCASALFFVGCNNITDNETVNIDSTEPVVEEVDMKQTIIDELNVSQLLVQDLTREADDGFNYIATCAWCKEEGFMHKDLCKCLYEEYIRQQVEFYMYEDNYWQLHNYCWEDEVKPLLENK